MASTDEGPDGPAGNPAMRKAPVMRVGVLLPSFRWSPEHALARAAEAEAAGVDGVFCYDHLWPMGQPERPAMAPFPLLGAVAASTTTLWIGTLVARIGLVPDDVLLGEFGALDLLAPGRVIAGLGTGDHLSAGENAAYGVPMAPPSERRQSLAHCARELVERDIAVWVGAGAGGTRTVEAARVHGGAVNLWGVSPDLVAVYANRFEVTWGGPCPELDGGGPDQDGAEALVAALARAGASWVVFSGQVSLPGLVAAAAAAAAEASAAEAPGEPDRAGSGA